MASWIRWSGTPAACRSCPPAWRPHTSAPPSSGSWASGSRTSSSEVPRGPRGPPSLPSVRAGRRAAVSLLRAARSAAGEAGPAAAGHGGGAEPAPGGHREDGGAPGRAEPAAGAGGHHLPRAARPGSCSWTFLWLVSLRLPASAGAPTCRIAPGPPLPAHRCSCHSAPRHLDLSCRLPL